MATNVSPTQFVRLSNLQTVANQVKKMRDEDNQHHRAVLDAIYAQRYVDECHTNNMALADARKAYINAKGALSSMSSKLRNRMRAFKHFGILIGILFAIIIAIDRVAISRLPASITYAELDQALTRSEIFMSIVSAIAIFGIIACVITYSSSKDKLASLERKVDKYRRSMNSALVQIQATNKNVVYQSTYFNCILSKKLDPINNYQEAKDVTAWCVNHLLTDPDLEHANIDDAYEAYTYTMKGETYGNR